MKLITILNFFHKTLGLEHGDIRPDNVINRNGYPVFIDFELTKPHKCGRKMSLEFGPIEPETEDFGCDELFNMMLSIGAWNRGGHFSHS